MDIARTRFIVVGVAAGVAVGGVGCTFGNPRDRFPSAEMEQLRALVVAIASDVSEEEARQELDTREPPVAAEPPEAVLDAVDVSRETIAGFDVVTLTPKRDASDLRVLYLHGGGWINPVGAG
ncbi:MAG TPA: hypothetical protein VGF99_18990, partial [Myxococcota bacterium]